jgi:hypothetical protein
VIKSWRHRRSCPGLLPLLLGQSGSDEERAGERRQYISTPPTSNHARSTHLRHSTLARYRAVTTLTTSEIAFCG